MAVEATIAEQEWTSAFGAVMAKVADCFVQREPRLLARGMCEAMLMELDARNCWTMAEALGHCDPHRLQHFDQDPLSWLWSRIQAENPEP